MCSTRAGGAPSASRSELQRSERDLGFLGGGRGGRGRSGDVRLSGLKGRLLWVGGGLVSAMEGFDWCFGAFGGLVGILWKLGRDWMQVFVVECGGCGGFLAEARVGS